MSLLERRNPELAVDSGSGRRGRNYIACSSLLAAALRELYGLEGFAMHFPPDPAAVIAELHRHDGIWSPGSDQTIVRRWIIATERAYLYRAGGFENRSDHAGLLRALSGQDRKPLCV